MARKGIETIEDMASRYLAGVQAAAPSGPIRVAGYCHGGLAALDLVRRLEAAGRTVEKVVLIDTFSLNARAAHASDRAHRLLAGTLAAGRAGPQAPAQRHAVGVGACQHICCGAIRRSCVG